MNRWIVLAAVAFFGVLLRILRGKPLGLPDRKTHVKILVGKDGTTPVVRRCPERLVTLPNDDVEWEVEFEPGVSGIEVWMRDFKHTDHGGLDPFQGSVADRKTKASSPKKIKDKVKPKLLVKLGLYKYTVYLNGNPADDPEIMIKEI